MHLTRIHGRNASGGCGERLEHARSYGRNILSETGWLEDPTWMSDSYGDAGFVQANNPYTQPEYDGMEDSRGC